MFCFRHGLWISTGVDFVRFPIFRNLKLAIFRSSVPSNPRQDGAVDNRLGLLYMFGGISLFGLTDALAKLLTETLPPMQVVWSRQSGLFVGVLIYIAIKGFGVLKSQKPALQMSRGALAAVSASLFIIGVSYVPLADAVAITFVAPFMVTVMGALILKETVGIRRWSAVIIGFIGTLIVIRPGLGVIHPAAFLLIIAAGAFACRQILSRVLAQGDKTVTTVAYTAIASWTLLCIPLPFIWKTPETTFEVALIVLLALVAAVAETLVIMALDAAQAVVVAPVQYILLLWGTMYGFLIFGQLPDFWTLIGAVVIIATGLYTLNRERVVKTR